MKYLVEKLEEACSYIEGEENKLLLDLNRKKESTGFSVSELLGLLQNFRTTEKNLAVAINEFEKLSDINEEEISDIIHPILTKSYENHRAVKISKEPDYTRMANILQKRGEDVSCIVEFGGYIFDPRIEELWKNHNVEAENIVDIYHHNMNGIEYSVKEIIDPIGYTIEGITPEYVIDMLTIKGEYGLHARPSTLVVQAVQKYEEISGINKVLIEKDKNEVVANSIMGLMMLGATKNSKLLVKYEKPTSKEESKSLLELRKELKNIIESD